uniref:Uncharacterized protein n=1 Tax=Kalanchoe fedtschenkoi TaxID=63787 RepID=A0A7N0SWF2_KALFE
MSADESTVHQPPRRPQLATIFSGQDISGLAEAEQPKNNNDNNNKGRVYSKSLSELEFEEVKGFMDLGFVFSEEDMDDEDLISIVPGVRRLGRGRSAAEQDGQASVKNRSRSVDSAAIRRPYLSEAWADGNERNTAKKPSLPSRRIPLPRSESDMKQSLRCWAHTVAESVSIVADADSVSCSSDSFSELEAHNPVDRFHSSNST